MESRTTSGKVNYQDLLENLINALGSYVASTNFKITTSGRLQNVQKILHVLCKHAVNIYAYNIRKNHPDIKEEAFKKSLSNHFGKLNALAKHTRLPRIDIDTKTAFVTPKKAYASLVNEIKPIISSLKTGWFGQGTLKESINTWIQNNDMTIQANSRQKKPKPSIPSQNITQEEIEHKFKLFMTSLGTGEKVPFKNGICNAFAFMNFRASLIDEEDKNLKRMEKLMTLDDDAIKELADHYVIYQNKRRSLIEIKECEDLIAEKNREINSCNMELSALTEQSKRGVSLAAGLVKMAEKKIRSLRNMREDLIENRISYTSGEAAFAKMLEAKDLYICINSMLAAFKPSAKLHLWDEKPVNQFDFMEILHLLPPDAFLPRNKKALNQETIKAEIKRIVKKVYAISFVFTEEELISLFNDKNIIQNGDFIQLSSTNHAIYLSNKDGKFKLYDPGLINIKPNTAEALVETIRHRFFTQAGHSSDYMPISIAVFQKEGGIARPAEIDFIKPLLKRRQGRLNMKSWDGVTSAFLAARWGNIKIIEKLLKNNADFNIPDNGNFTPAHMAANHGHSNVIRAIAEHNIKLLQKANEGCFSARVSLDAQDNEKWTAVHFAAYRGDAKVLRELAKGWANLNAVTSQGWSAAHVAIYKGHNHLISLLADCGTDLNAGGLDKQTPLHHAIKNSKLEAISILIANDVDLDIRDSAGKTPLDYANEEIKYYVALQRIKKYIEDSPSLQAHPIVIDHLQQISEADHQWESVFNEIVNISNKFKPSSVSLLFFSAQSKTDEPLSYISWLADLQVKTQQLRLPAANSPK